MKRGLKSRQAWPSCVNVLEKEKCESVEASKQVARLRVENEPSVPQLTSALDEEKSKSLSLAQQFESKQALIERLVQEKDDTSSHSMPISPPSKRSFYASSAKRPSR